MRRFADAMKSLHSDAGFEAEHLVSGYDFGSLSHCRFVDVGGSQSHVSIDMAKRFPNVWCIVQHMAAAVELGRSQIPEDLAERVQSMIHDFRMKQPVKNAAIYYFRWIFHDWFDIYAVNILR